MDLIVKRGRIVTQDGLIYTDIGIRDGKIIAIGNDLGQARTTIDAGEALIFPGLIDPHVHFHLPVGDTFSSDDFLTGSRAALFGGVTTFLDFTNQKPGTPLYSTWENRISEISGNTYADFGLHAVVNSWSNSYQEEIEKLLTNGVNSFKFFMCGKGSGERHDDGLLHRLMQGLHDKGILILHAESGALLDQFTEDQVDSGHLDASAHLEARPVIVEEEAVDRAIFFARKTGTLTMILHLSSGDAALQVKKARAEGVPVMAETCPQYLLLDDSIYKGLNAYLFATCPPVRKRRDQEILWEQLALGNLQVVSSDHCPFWRRDKDKWGKDFRKLYFGLPGVETILPILYTFGVDKGLLSLQDLVRLTSSNAARIYGLSRNKGWIQVGFDADLVLFDPEESWQLRQTGLHMACDFNPYEGLRMKGRVKKVIRAGRLVVSDESFLELSQDGRFQFRGKPEFI
ncbi:MAG: dihydropyrimidinase [Candidatus Wallbacteria bacterium]|nr:dihydropyrimidinase [Candidatus Wallbacteria bacterium]